MELERIASNLYRAFPRNAEKLSRELERLTGLLEETGAAVMMVSCGGNGKKAEAGAPAEAAEKGGYRVLTLVLRGEIGVLYERYCRRMTKENRHPVHLSAPLHLRDEFERYVLAARAEAVPGERIEIDATDFSYQTDEALLGRIDAFMKNDTEETVR